ncbi:MAG TPA: hypothetical protein VH593_04720 [Ktedonobacteraceae bacterium]|jgi:hypothetical protein
MGNNSFNAREHLMMIKNRQGQTEYLPVQWRLVWFRQECPNGTIETEIVHLDLDKETEEEAFAWNSEKKRSEKITKTAPGLAIVRAVVRDGKGGIATGTKMEKAASFGDFLEKAETGAVGRALAALGFGTQFTADELDERHRIVDAPVDRVQSNGSNGSSDGVAETAEASVTEQQLASIHKLYQHLDKPEPEGVNSISFLAAKRLIQQLTAEYRQTKQNSKAS